MSVFEPVEKTTFCARCDAEKGVYELEEFDGWCERCATTCDWCKGRLPEEDQEEAREQYDEHDQMILCAGCRAEYDAEYGAHEDDDDEPS